MVVMMTTIVRTAAAGRTVVIMRIEIMILMRMLVSMRRNDGRGDYDN